MHRFTGALVAMRTGRRSVPGSARLPGHGAGTNATTLRATAFGGGALQITLALPENAHGPHAAGHS
jgi:hypothetical protein